MRTFTKDTALSEQGRGAAWHVWINERNGRGTAWERHVRSMLCVNRPLEFQSAIAAWRNLTLPCGTEHRYAKSSHPITELEETRRLLKRNLPRIRQNSEVNISYEFSFNPFSVPCSQIHVPQKSETGRLGNLLGASGGVGWIAAPQDGRFRVRFLVDSLNIFKWPFPILPLFNKPGLLNTWYILSFRPARITVLVYYWVTDVLFE